MRLSALRNARVASRERDDMADLQFIGPRDYHKLHTLPNQHVNFAAIRDQGRGTT